MDNCIFCKIIKGEIPSFKVWEDQNHLAFLSIAPIKPGHTLIIPKKHGDYIFGMDDTELAALSVASKPVAKKLQQALNPKTGKVGVMVAGLEVPHTHIHLIPMDAEGDLTFANAKPSTPEELKEVLEKINSIT
jgi:histidine triad (HIT) family protein